MAWHFSNALKTDIASSRSLQGPAGASLAEPCSDGGPFAPWKWTSSSGGQNRMGDIEMKTSHGRGFEQQVENSAAHYERQQILLLRKVEPPTRVVGGGAARKVIFLDNPFLDFVGSWTERGGRMIVLEAKETHEPRLSYGGGLTERQLEAMHRWWQVGAAVGLVWNWQTGGGLGVRIRLNICTAPAPSPTSPKPTPTM